MTIQAKKAYKILSIDGGGIRGLCTAAALAAFEKRFGCSTAACFDMLCGTSTGAIITAALGIGMKASEIADFFRHEGPKIFPYISWPTRCLAFLKQVLFKSKYDNDILRSSLEKVFGAKTLSDINIDICIPVFDISQGLPRIFKTGRLAAGPSPLLVDVLLAASAAPGYFPIHSINSNLYIDGGIWANNPALVGLCEVLRYQSMSHSPYTCFNILSVGSIENSIGDNVNKKTLSFWKWYKTEWLLESYFQAQSKMINYYAATISTVLPVKYVRLASPRFTETNFKIEIDNASPETLIELERLGALSGELESTNPDVYQFFSRQ